MTAHLPTLDWEYLRWQGASTYHDLQLVRPVLGYLGGLWRSPGEAGTHRN
jgi:hypothetical protein